MNVPYMWKFSLGENFCQFHLCIPLEKKIFFSVCTHYPTPAPHTLWQNFCHTTKCDPLVKFSAREIFVVCSMWLQCLQNKSVLVSRSYMWLIIRAICEKRDHFMLNAKFWQDSSYHHSKTPRVLFLVHRHPALLLTRNGRAPKVRHKMANFWVSVILVIATLIPEMGGAQNFPQCRAMI